MAVGAGRREDDDDNDGLRSWIGGVRAPELEAVASTGGLPGAAIIGSEMTSAGPDRLVIPREAAIFDLKSCGRPPGETPSAAAGAIAEAGCCCRKGVVVNVAPAAAKGCSCCCSCKLARGAGAAFAGEDGDPGKEGALPVRSDDETGERENKSAEEVAGNACEAPGATE